MLSWRSCAGVGMDIGIAEYQAQFVGIPNDHLLLALRAEFHTRALTFSEDFAARHAFEVERRLALELATIPGVVPLLEGHSGSRAVASASNPGPLAEKLAFTGLDGYFALHIYSTKQAGRGKPTPDVYLIAAEELGLLPEARTVIEDSANGAKVGVAAGLSTRLIAAGADAVFDAYGAIQAHLAAGNLL